MAFNTGADKILVYVYRNIHIIISFCFIQSSERSVAVVGLTNWEQSHKQKCYLKIKT